MSPERARTITVPRAGVPLASRWSRFVAWLVDKVLEISTLIPALIAAVAAETGSDAALFFRISAACYLALWAYQAWLRATQGQTIGKRTVRIRIVDHDDGSNPGFWRAVFLRDLVPAFIGLLVGPLFAIVDIALIFGRPRRCVHDYMAATSVVLADVERPEEAFD